MISDLHPRLLRDAVRDLLREEHLDHPCHADVLLQIANEEACEN